MWTGIAALVAGIVEVTLVEGDPVSQGVEIVQIGDVLDEVIRDCTLEAEVRGWPDRVEWAVGR